MKSKLLSPQKIIELLDLQPLDVEGGLFRQAYRSKNKIPMACLPTAFSRQVHPFGTAIYYLLTSDENSFSAMHRLPGDEIYHFYLGDAVEMLNLFPDGRAMRIVIGQDLLEGQKVQYVCPGGVWQGCRLKDGGSFALLGTTMAPGFLEMDYVGAAREDLISHYPDESDLIAELTRSDDDLRMK